MHKFETGPIEQLSPTDSGTYLYEGFDPLITFNAGPVYHGAPLNTLLTTQRLGGTFVTLRKFDSEQTLRAIQDWKVVAAQFVPTMFVRMLSLPDEVRSRYDLSSLKFVLHAAAPCPVEIKRRMIDWLGPIIAEYYSATENLGSTFITSEEWLRKPGSVGKANVGILHICGEDGTELPAGQDGLIYFEVPKDRGFSYVNDPQRTEQLRHPTQPGWYAVGDIGHVDEDGYLFLTDRKDFMIISGGVNIYPQIVEDVLIVHPKVLDVAVIGVPNPDYGEEVKAIVQPKVWQDAGNALEQELIAWCRQRTSPINCPRTFQFVEDLPRLPSGKLAKKELRRLYGSEKPW